MSISEIDRFFKLVKKRTPEVVRVLLEAGADVNARCKADFTALMTAAGINKDPEITRVLLEAGANVNARNEGGHWTALMWAVLYNDNPEVIRVLLEAGADPKAKDVRAKTAWDHAQDNKKLKGTKAYEKLREATFE